jgi:hypothetical protein
MGRCALSNFLGLISIDPWTIIVSACNLLIIYLIIKKVFYAPVMKIMKEREDQIKEQYSMADKAKKEAEESKAIYTERERSFGNHVFVNANRLQYMTQTAKVNMARDLGDRGILTINEIRELFNYGPIEGGDVAYIRGEYKPVETLEPGEQPDIQPEEEPAQEEPVNE